MCGLGKSAPKMTPPPPPPPIQIEKAAEKAPDQETFKRKNVKNMRTPTNSGNSGTILTGAGGDVVPTGQLGTNTLLGG